MRRGHLQYHGSFILCTRVVKHYHNWEKYPYLMISLSSFPFWQSNWLWFWTQLTQPLCLLLCCYFSCLWVAKKGSENPPNFSTFCINLAKCQSVVTGVLFPQRSILSIICLLSPNTFQFLTEVLPSNLLSPLPCCSEQHWKLLSIPFPPEQSCS